MSSTGDRRYGDMQRRALAAGLRPADAVAHPVDLESLAEVRAVVADEGRRHGLPAIAADDFVLAANELATNAVRHGGGAGRMWVWSASGFLYCQVSDRGPGMADRYRVGAPPPGALTGRGLWMIRLTADLVHIDAGAAGTTVTIAVALSG